MPENLNEHEQVIADRLNRCELDIMMCIHQAQDQNELTSLACAINSSLLQTTRLFAEEKGYDIDEVHEAISKFMLYHPESQ